MKFIEWTEDLSVNIESIDQQHKKLIMMVNELQKKSVQKNLFTVSKLLTELRKYAQNHFKDEEKFLYLYKCENNADHEKRHEEFIDKVKLLTEKTYDGKEVTVSEISNFLKEWILNHITLSDMSLKEKALKLKGK